MLYHKLQNCSPSVFNIYCSSQIYKSTRCKDMQQYLFCPRGPFCAFAHDDDEAQVVYDISDTQYPDTTSPPTSVSVSLNILLVL